MTNSLSQLPEKDPSGLVDLGDTASWLKGTCRREFYKDTEGYLIVRALEISGIHGRSLDSMGTEAQFNFWDTKLEDFLRAEAVCQNATAKAEVGKALAGVRECSEAEKKDCSAKLEALPHTLGCLNA